MYKFKQILTGAALTMLAFNVMAVPSPSPITGTLSMTGSLYALDAGGTRTSDASTAKAIDFDFFGSNRFRVISGSDAFAGLNGQMGNITDFTFDAFSGPISNFWSVDIFSFELTDITRVVSNDPVNFLRLSGEGIISATGYDNTKAGWSFASTTSGGGIFSWSANTAAQTVAAPEPGMLVLLAMGLIGFGLRKKI